MKKLIPLSLMLLLLVGVGTIQAQTAEQPWNFGIDLGFHSYNGELGNEILEYSEADFTYGIGLAYYLNSYFDIALKAKLMQLDRVNGPNDSVVDQRNTSFETDNLNVNLMLRWKVLGSDTDLNPYLTAGAGINLLQFDVRKDESGTYFGLPFGAGFNFEINDNVVLNFEAIYNRTFEDGLDSYPLTASEAASGIGARQPDPSRPEGNDGYPDDGADHDDFLVTSAGITFNFGGDEDRMSIEERLLRQSMKNLEAAENSSAEASEKLREAQQLNEETQAALQKLSDDMNQSMEKSQELRAEMVRIVNNIQFEFDNSEIIEPAYDELNSLADIMQEYPNLSISIEGRADERGSSTYNENLSRRRAEAVRDYLVNEGVNSSKISTSAYGESDPLMAGNSETSYSQNRSVRVTLSYDDGSMMEDDSM